MSCFGAECQARGFPLLRWGKPYRLDPPPAFAAEAAEAAVRPGFFPCYGGEAVLPEPAGDNAGPVLMPEAEGARGCLLPRQTGSLRRGALAQCRFGASQGSLRRGASPPLPFPPGPRWLGGAFPHLGWGCPPLSPGEGLRLPLPSPPGARVLAQSPTRLGVPPPAGGCRGRLVGRGHGEGEPCWPWPRPWSWAEAAEALSTGPGRQPRHCQEGAPGR